MANSISSEYVNVNGVRLHYLRAGSGARAIMIVHGNSHCGGVYAPLVEALAGDRWTVIATDLRGHGWAEKPDHGYDWGSLRDDVVGLVRAQNLGDLIFVGHSRGGGVSLLAAAALGARGALVYEPTSPVQVGDDGRSAPTPEPPRMAELAERSRRRRDVFGSREDLVRRYRSQEAFSGWREEYWEAFLRYGTVAREDGSVELCVPPRAVARLFEATFGFDAWRDVYQPDLPVLAIYGDRSGRLREGHDPIAGIRTIFPRAEWRMFPNATHSGPMEQPEAFERIVREFAANLDF